MTFLSAPKNGLFVLMVLLAVFSACSMPKGVKLEQLKGQYEDIGRLSARAIQCDVSVPVHIRELTEYAKGQGADEQEAESLVSYHDAAMVEERKNNAPCPPDEKSRVEADLNQKMQAIRIQ